MFDKLEELENLSVAMSLYDNLKDLFEAYLKFMKKKEDCHHHRRYGLQRRRSLQDVQVPTDVSEPASLRGADFSEDFAVGFHSG
jgi:hypothetical protein